MARRKSYMGARANFMLRIPVAINEWLSKELGTGKPTKNAIITGILEKAMKADNKEKAKEQKKQDRIKRLSK